MLFPAYFGAVAACDDNDVPCYEAAIDSSWQVGVVANFATALFMFALSFIGKYVAEAVPMAVLLSSLATICISFLVLANVLGNFAQPISVRLMFGLVVAML